MKEFLADAGEVEGGGKSRESPPDAEEVEGGG